MVALLLPACTPAPSGLSRPNRVALGPAGEVYVSDFHHDRIVEFDADGRFVRAFGRQGIGEGELWRVTAMAVGDDGSLMVANRRPVSDSASDATTSELKRFRDGEEVALLQLDGRVLPADGWIDGLAPAAGGGWLVVDTTHGELTVVDGEGRLSGRFGGIPRPDAAPSSVLRAGDWYWVVEKSRHRISRMHRDGTEEVVVLLDEGHGPPSFPTAVAVCRDEWFAVADLGNHRVERYATDGRRIGGFVPEPAGPDQPVQLLDLAMSADCGRLYLVDSKGDRVLVTDPDGTVVQALSRW